MVSKGIGFWGENLEAVKARYREGQLNALRGLVGDEVIWRACRKAGYSYRRRLLTPLVTVFHYLSAALWPEESFQAAAAYGALDVSSGSLSKARQRLPLAVIDELDGYVSRLGQYLSLPYARCQGLRVVTIDGTCVSMEDVTELRDHFGIVNTRHGKSKFPEARLVVAMLAATGVVVAHRLGPYRASEHALALDLLGVLREGDLLVADAHFAGSNLYYRYMEHGLEFVTPAHQCLKVNRLRRVRKYGDGSFLAVVPIWKSQRRKHPYLPETMTLRFVPVRLHSRRGNVMSHLVTSLDADRYPADTIRGFYRKRWPVETTFYELKLPLSADVLRSKTVDGIYKEAAAKVAALNLVRCLMIQTAQRSQCDPLRLSFAQSRRVAVCYSLKMSAAPVSMLADLFDQMLAQIALVTNPSRPGRVEPRAVRREFKHFQRLKTTRREWRASYALTA